MTGSELERELGTTIAANEMAEKEVQRLTGRLQEMESAAAGHEVLALAFSCPVAWRFADTSR